VPTNILIEKYDALTNRLVASDKWDVTSIDTDVPGPDQFKPEYQPDTVVEYFSPLSANSSIFRYSNMADTDRLLAERLTYTATQGDTPQNCATAAVRYTAARLGKSTSDKTLARMIDNHGQTTMADLKQSARRLGLHNRAVRTDVDTLKNLPDCQAILHIPDRNHFIVLDHFEDQYVWLVDLSNSKFLYRQQASLLPADWSSGVALLLSDRPIRGNFHDIDDTALNNIAGGDGWSCTQLYQEEYVETCWESLGDCGGWFAWYYQRWNCEWAPSGTCPYYDLPFVSEIRCSWDPFSGCKSTGDWYTTYNYACD
jgi:hypothetical protein